MHGTLNVKIASDFASVHILYYAKPQFETGHVILSSVVLVCSRPFSNINRACAPDRSGGSSVSKASSSHLTTQRLLTNG